MEPYKLRVIDEYRQLDFAPTCPRELLERQCAVMNEDLDVLRQRAMIKGIPLSPQ